MTKVKDIILHLESLAPLALQEDYDNAGLITGNREEIVKGVLICLDSTEAVMDEAIQKECNMVIAHHPIIFRGLKKIIGRNYIERAIIKSIKNDIAIYAIHTNLDNIKQGVNHQLCEILGLHNIRILKPLTGKQLKLITFIPKENTLQVLDALHQA
ncbi:Nif3-like dinuclear metal center hexameric protein, partial [Bacteroidota bacterium]